MRSWRLRSSTTSLRDRMSVDVAVTARAMSGLPRRRRVQAFEQCHAVGEHLMVIGHRGEQRPDRDVNSARFLMGILAVAQVSLVNDLSEPDQPAVAQARAFDECLERAILALVAELRSWRVEGDRVLRELRRRCEHELGVGIDEALDQPRRSDAIDVWARARDPPSPPEFGEIERRTLFAA